MLESLPDKPLPFEFVTNLPERADSIVETTPLTVAENQLTGEPEEVLGFVLTTSTASWFALVFDGDEGCWKTVFEKHYESEDEAENEFGPASEAIMEYWQEKGDMEKTDDFETEDGYDFEEYTLR